MLMYDSWEEVSVSWTKCARVGNEEGTTVLLVFKTQEVARLIVLENNTIE